MTGVRLSNNSFYQTSMDIMSGAVEPECLGEHWERSLDFHVYKAACKILDFPHKPARAALIAEYPERIGDLIRTKMISIHNIRLKQIRMLQWQEDQQRKRRREGLAARHAEMSSAQDRQRLREAGVVVEATDGWKDWV